VTAVQQCSAVLLAAMEGDGGSDGHPKTQGSALVRNFLIMTLGFSVNHATVVTVIALATAHLGPVLGAYDLAVFNAVYVLTGLVVQGIVVQKLGLKGSLLAGTMLYCLYVLSFLAATLCTPGSLLQWTIAISGAVLGGFGAGFLWSAQGAYFTVNAELYAQAAQIPASMATGQFSGTFAFWYLATEVATKILASIVMGSAWGGEGAEHAVYVMFTIMAGLSATCLLGIRDLRASEAPAELALEEGDGMDGGHDSKGAGEAEGGDLISDAEPLSELAEAGAAGEASSGRLSGKSSRAVDLMRTDPKCLLMAPTEMSFGFVAAMLNGWVNGVAVKEGIGKHNIGYLIALSTTCAALASAFFSWYTARSAQVQSNAGPARVGDWLFVGKRGPMLTGAASYAVFGIILLLLPLIELGQWRYLLPIYIVQGIGRGNFESTNKAVFADFFPGAKAEAAFANFVIWSGLSMTIGYAIIPHLPSVVNSLLCVLSAVVGGLCYIVADRESDDITLPT
jgi:MFS family permease